MNLSLSVYDIVWCIANSSAEFTGQSWCHIRGLLYHGLYHWTLEGTERRTLSGARADGVPAVERWDWTLRAWQYCARELFILAFGLRNGQRSHVGTLCTHLHSCIGLGPDMATWAILDGPMIFGGTLLACRSSHVLLFFDSCGTTMSCMMLQPYLLQTHMIRLVLWTPKQWRHHSCFLQK